MCKWRISLWSLSAAEVGEFRREYTRRPRFSIKLLTINTLYRCLESIANRSPVIISLLTGKNTGKITNSTLKLAHRVPLGL